MEIKNVSLELIKAYIEAVSLESSVATSKRKLASIKRFYEWAKENGHLEINPFTDTLSTGESQPVINDPVYTIKNPDPQPEIILPSPAVALPESFKPSRSYRKIYIATLGLTSVVFALAVVANSSLPLKIALLIEPQKRPQVLSTSISVSKTPNDDSNIYQNGVLTLSSSDSKIKSMGNLLILGSSVVLSTDAGSDGDITLAPAAQGKVNILTSNTQGNSVHIDNANLTQGALISASAGNNMDSYYLLNLESGAPLVTRFSVDANGNTQISGSVDIVGDLKLGGILQSSTLVLKRLKGSADAMALLVDDGNARFDGQVQLGSFEGNPSANGQGTIIYNSIDKEAYLWNGTNWKSLGDDDPPTLWREVSNILAPTSTDKDFAIGDPSSPIFLINHLGNMSLKGNTNTPLVVFDNEGEGDLLSTNAAGVTRFRVANTGAVFLNLPGTASTNALCHNPVDGTEELVDCETTPTADYMEMYPTTNYSNKIFPTVGDIVTTSDIYTIDKDGQKLVKLTLTNHAYDQNIIGIISDSSRANDFNSVGHNIADSDHPLPVALSGRVLVKIDPSSPNIEPGDLITSSDSPGRGMKATKAGYVVGKALESWTQGSDSVLVLVGNSYYTPEVAKNEENADKIYTTGIESKDGAKMTSTEDMVRMITSIENDQKAITDKVEKSAIGSVSGDSEIKQLGVVSADNIYVTELGTFQNLSVVDSVGVGMDFIINTVLDKLTGKTLTTINTMDAPLQLQSLALSPLEIMAGKFLIDTDGNVRAKGNVDVQGNLSAKQIATNKLVLLSDPVSNNNSEVGSSEIDTNATAGHSTLKGNNQELTIKNANVKDSSLIYVSPTSSTDNMVLYVKEKASGYFKVGFTRSIDQDVDFDWWIIDLE